MIRHTVPYPEIQGHRPAETAGESSEDAATA